MKLNIKYLLPFLIIFLINGCSSSGKKAVEKLYYRFPDTTLSMTSNMNMIVKRPTAMGIIGNRPMVVQTNGGALKQMYNNFWLDSPKILLFNYLEKTLQSKQNNQTTESILYSEILHLEKKQNTAILEIKFIVKDNNGATTFNKTYLNELKSTDNSIPAFSRSIGILLKQMIQQLIVDLQQ